MSKVATLAALTAAAMEAESIAENLRAEVITLADDKDTDKAVLKAKRAELRTAESTLKKASNAVMKEEARAEKEAEREAVRAQKEAEKEARKAEREAKRAEREAEKAAKQKERMPEQNGIRRPRPNTLCGRTWAIADTLSAEMGQPVPIANLLEAASAEGLNEGNTKAEYARWRKFNGVTGRVTAPKAEEAEAA